MSFSQISAHIDCPYKLWLRYFKKCTPVYFKPELFYVGLKVHDAVKGYYKNNFKLKPTKAYILYYMYEELKKIWDVEEETEQNINDYKRAYKNLEGTSEYEYKRTLLSNTKPLTEIPKDTGKYYIIVDGYDKELNYPWDWKTSKSAGLGRDKILQACTYKLGLEDLYDDIYINKFWFLFPDPIEERIVYFDGNKKTKNIDQSLKLISDTQQKVQECFRKKKFEKKPRTAGMCNYCDMKYYCTELRL